MSQLMEACKLQPRSAQRRLRLARALAAENGVLEPGACRNGSKGTWKHSKKNVSKVHDDKSGVIQRKHLQSEMDIALCFVHSFYASIFALERGLSAEIDRSQCHKPRSGPFIKWRGIYYK